MKKHLGILILVVLLAAVLTGCGGGDKLSITSNMSVSSVGDLNPTYSAEIYFTVTNNTNDTVDFTVHVSADSTLFQNATEAQSGRLAPKESKSYTVTVNCGTKKPENHKVKVIECEAISG